MAANKDLIAMARDLAKANGFNDIGKVVDDEIQKSIGIVEDMLKQRQASKDKTDAYLRDYLHNMPNANMQKIPENMRAEVTAKVQKAHKEYGKAARVAATLSPSDEGYAEAVQTMNGVKQKFQALDASFNQLAEWKLKELKAAEDGVFSNGNNTVDRDFNAAVTTDQAEFKIGDDFQIQFKRKDDKQAGLNKLYEGMGQEALTPSEQWLGLSQLPKSTYVDEEFQKNIIGLLGRYQVNKVPLNEESKELLKAELSMALGNDRDSIVSAATDSPIDGSDTFGFDTDLIQNPERTQELREKIIDSYAEVIFAGGENAYEQGQAAKEADIKLRNKYTIRDNKLPDFDLDKFLKEKQMKEALANGGGATGGSGTPTENETTIANFKAKNLKNIEDILNDKDKGVGDVTTLLSGLAKKLKVETKDVVTLVLSKDLKEKYVSKFPPE